MQLLSAIRCVPELINLVGDLVAILEAGRGGVLGVFHFQLDLLVPRVVLEVPADECAVGRVVKRVGRAVRARERAARLHPVLEVDQFFLRERVARGEEQHDVEVLERLLVHAATALRFHGDTGDFAEVLRVLVERGILGVARVAVARDFEAVLRPDLLEGLFGEADGIVDEPAAVRDQQQPFCLGFSSSEIPVAEEGEREGE